MIIRKPTNYIGEHKYRESQVLSFEVMCFLHRRNLQSSACSVWRLEGVGIYFGWRGAVSQLSIYKFSTSPPVLIHISHLALWFLLDLSLCKILRDKWSPLSLFSFMNIKAVPFFALLHELPCFHLLFIFQSCWNLLMPEAHSLVLQLLSTIICFYLLFSSSVN